MPHEKSSVPIVGGSGVVGSEAARTLRRPYPALPTFAARDMNRARSLASEFGNATTTTVDLARTDLGLPGDVNHSAVVTAVRDRS